MNFNEIAHISNFLYACVYYLMGHTDKANNFLIAEDSKLVRNFKKFIDAQQAFDSKQTLSERVDDIENYSTIVSNINGIKKELDKTILNYYDEAKYERNWFQFNNNLKIEKAKANERLKAIIYYILRGYCSFRQTQQMLRGTLGASKQGLNDLVQAESLWHDLYYYSKLSGETDFYSYAPESFRESIRPINGSHKMTYNSLLFVLRLLISFLKGNIYREIYFQESALDNYFNAIRLFMTAVNIHDKLYDNKQHGRFLCPIIAKSFYEVSKLLFDKGQIVESLIAQVKSIKYILMISSLVNEAHVNENATKLFSNIIKTIKVLDNVKQSFGEYIRKDMILSLFIDLADIKGIQGLLQDSGEKTKTILLSTESPLISPEKVIMVSNLITDSLKPLMADVLARIGFTLYTIRLRIEEDKKPGNMLINKETIIRYNNNMQDQIKGYLKGYANYQSELGNYTRTLLGDKDVEFISPRIERVFCSSAIDELRKVGGDIQKERLAMEQLTEELRKVAGDDQKERSIIEKVKKLKTEIQKKLSAKLTIHSLTNVGNITAIPLRIDHFLAQEGYEERTKGRFGRSTINKLVILRRWQSFNPKVPRPKGQDIRGGGYFLIWNKKGIVIDPGYDFIQSFYEEGYSIGDIDAIIVTHTHPDHEDELNTIITLLAEWNQYQEKQRYISGKSKREEEKGDDKLEDKKKWMKRIDLFLNEGSYRKYNSWLYGKDIMIKKIYLLQSSLWDKTSEKSSDRKNDADNNPIIDLRSTYNMEIEIVPSWHDELIDKHSSIGFILHLYEEFQLHNDNLHDPTIKIGFTGDTEFYKGIEDNYRGVDILVAHLGDIKIRELLSKLNVVDRIIDNFADKWYEEIKRLQRDERHAKFIDYLILQDLYGVEEDFLKPTGLKIKCLAEQFKILREATSLDEIKHNCKYYCLPREDYIYENHLGINGLFKLYDALIEDESRRHKFPTKLMIIGELPEELQSYRHVIACIMEEMRHERKDRCLTGDIGLTIGLPTKDIKYGRPRPDGNSPVLAIRCMKCFQNNEYIKGIKKNKNDSMIYLPHYHSLEKIQETCLKACASRIVWFCNDFHARTPDYAGLEFFVAPDLRAVWG